MCRKSSHWVHFTSGLGFELAPNAYRDRYTTTSGRQGTSLAVRCCDRGSRKRRSRRQRNLRLLALEQRLREPPVQHLPQSAITRDGRQTVVAYRSMVIMYRLRF